MKNKALPHNASIKIYYFSGTGNTQLIAKQIVSYFAKYGHEACTEKMESAPQVELTENMVLGLGFPVAAFSTYPLVWNFIDALPQANGTQVFAFDTLGGISMGGIMGKLRSKLSAKGYTPLCAAEIRMPVNIFFVMPPKLRQRRLDNGKTHAERFCEKISSGTGHWRKIPIIADMMYLFGKFFWWIMQLPLHQRTFKVCIDEKKCTHCGLCAQKCPAKNITIAESAVIGDGCQYCLRCVAVCHVNALTPILSSRALHYRAEGFEP